MSEEEVALMRKSPLESTAQSQGKTQEVEQDPSVPCMSFG